MNDFNAKRPGPRLSPWDALSAAVLLATLGIGSYFALIFINPNTPLNPLPPITPFSIPTPTVTPIGLPPTWTPTPVNATETPTLVPTITLLPSPTSFSLIPPTNTPSPTATPKALFSAAVKAVESSIIPRLVEKGCNWQGVAGTVDDANNSPIIGMVVRLVGTLNGRPINMMTVSGIAPDYGKSGWEFVLGDTPVASGGTLLVQLLDQASLPLSDNVYLTTYNDCKKNLILVRFKKNR